jgi:hypothetical protein
VLISLLVALLTSPINLVLDFIFNAILFAPTLNIVSEAVSSDSREGTSPISRARGTLRRTPAFNVRPIARREKSERALFFADTTRVVPPEVVSAHDTVSAYTADLVATAGSKVPLHSSLTKAKLDASYRKISKIETHKRATQRYQKDISDLSLVDINTKEIFIRLKVEMEEQRKILKRNQQESFDFLWGSVDLLS